MAIRAYKAAKTIGKTLEAILAQETDFPFEVIVADDASPDDTLAVCRAYQRQAPDKLRILRAKQNGGLCVNDVLAHAHARGEWIADCDADDLWLDPRKLQKQLDACRAHGAVFCATTFYFDNVKTRRRWVPLFPDRTIIPPKNIPKYYFQTSTLFYRQDVYWRMVKECDVPFEGDCFKLHCLARYGKILYLNDVCSVYTVGGGYYSSSSVLTHTWIPGNDFAMMMRYGHPSRHWDYGLRSLTQFHRCLHPRLGFTRAEYEARKELLWSMVWNVALRLLPHPKAIVYLCKIYHRSRHLRAA